MCGIMQIMGDDIMQYCKNCGQNVTPIKKFSVVWFIIDCLTLVGGAVYIIYFLFFKKKTCPVCNGNNFEHEHTIGEADNIIQAPSTKEKWKELQEKIDQQSIKAEAQYASAKERTAETIRKRKAGELPWQIAKAEKKRLKEEKT